MSEVCSYEVWTDGACSPNPGLGGWAAIVVPKDGNESVLTGSERDTTNNRMELMAAVEGLSAVPAGSIVDLYTDSQYLVKAFTERWLIKWSWNGWQTAGNKPVKNPDLWKRLMELSEARQVTWIWLKGHADNEINDRCDQLAVEARLRLSKPPV